jgi:hypothetical protein
VSQARYIMYYNIIVMLCTIPAPRRLTRYWQAVHELRIGSRLPSILVDEDW